MFQTKKQIAALLDSAGLRLRKRYGQHFLIDRNLMNKLVESAQIDRADVVLEIGAGTGSLTGLLARRAGAVVAVEIDPGLCAIAAEQLQARGHHNVRLIQADILARKSELAPRVLGSLRQEQARLGGRTRMVANLPFDVASPVLMDLLLAHPRIDPLCFTVQKEVAQRILSPAGRRHYGPMSVLIQAVADVTRLAPVPRQAFWPGPQVDAMMLRIDGSAAKRSRIAPLTSFAAMVRTLFGHRRKTLRHSIREAYPLRVLDALRAGPIDLNRRPETLSVEEWIDLWGRIESALEAGNGP
jgi:16S rRNA (adenine1518-N6/adenine1519-N6)-dimethyltransferase